MCGFVGYLGKRDQSIKDHFDKISHRGPDSTSTLMSNTLTLTFHRLAINGLDNDSNQPMNLKIEGIDHLWLVCNGEIYNHKNLSASHNIDLKTGSDCEIILHLFNKIGIEETCKSLDGVFAFCIYDARSNTLYAARDRYGVRPSFIAKDGEEVAIASEMKALTPVFSNVAQFPPGSWWSSKAPGEFNKFFSSSSYTAQAEDVDFESASAKVRSLLSSAVKKRLMAEREIGCLLSGGLDSSLIASLVNSMSERPVKTFSIGMPGSPDVAYAQKVADWIGSDHHVVRASAEDFIDAVEDILSYQDFDRR